MFGRTLIASLMEQNEIGSMISNEAEDTSGRTAAEIERVIYARVTSFDFLERATGAERQEQWSIKIPKSEENAGSGSIRVRKVTNLREPGAAVQYILTTKLDIGQKGSSAETSEQSSADQFNVFQYMANKGMMKDRYVFSIDGSDCVWEVDCFQKEVGGAGLYHEWVKVDLEKWGKGKELPQLPFTAAETMDGDGANQTEETKAKISRLYQEVFLVANTKQPLGTPAELQDAPHGQPGVAADGNEQPAGMESKPENDPDKDNAEDAAANPENEDDQANVDGADKPPKDGDDAPAKKPGDEGFAEGLGDATKEAFSSAGQVLLPFVPVLGPLITTIYAQRGTDLGIVQTSQHTTKSVSSVDSNGHKTSRVEKTGSYQLSDLADAKDYIGHIERAVKEVVGNKKVNRIDLTLWPQKDGRVGIFNIKTDRDGETKVFTENNPGKLKWFSLSLAGKRIIRIEGADVSNFKFNGRTITCPFNGKTVEFDVGQLRHLKYQTEPKNNSFEIVEYNFDA